jgi:hypothetical protein
LSAIGTVYKATSYTPPLKQRLGAAGLVFLIGLTMLVAIAGSLFFYWASCHAAYQVPQDLVELDYQAALSDRLYSIGFALGGLFGLMYFCYAITLIDEALSRD